MTIKNDCFYLLRVVLQEQINNTIHWEMMPKGTPEPDLRKRARQLADSHNSSVVIYQAKGEVLADWRNNG